MEHMLAVWNGYVPGLWAMFGPAFFMSYLVAPIVYTPLVKFAARIFYSTRVSWKHAYFFSLLEATILLLVGLLEAAIEAGVGTGAISSSYRIPSVGYFAIVLILALGVGVSYFASRAKSPAGSPLSLRARAGFAVLNLSFVLGLNALWVYGVPALLIRMSGSR